MGRGLAPGQAAFDTGKPGGLVLGQPQEKVPHRFKALRGQGDEHFQISDGAHGGKVECLQWVSAKQTLPVVRRAPRLD